jgi:hypothetical protein
MGRKELLNLASNVLNRSSSFSYMVCSFCFIDCVCLLSRTTRDSLVFTWCGKGDPKLKLPCETDFLVARRIRFGNT